MFVSVLHRWQFVSLTFTTQHTAPFCVSVTDPKGGQKQSHSERKVLCLTLDNGNDECSFKSVISDLIFMITDMIHKIYILFSHL